MRKSFKGKFLVRPNKMSNGTPVVVLCGVFLPNFDTNALSDGNGDDEMWVAELEVKDGGLRFHNKVDMNKALSPEDFLEGEHQSPAQWKDKEQLDLFNPHLDL